MKVTFRCKASGNKVSFTNENDIEHMRKEPQYEEMKDESKAEDNAKINAKQENGQSDVGNTNESKHEENADEGQDAKVLKKRGRPVKSKQIEYEVI